MKKEGKKRFGVLVSLFMIGVIVCGGIVPLNVLAVGQLPFYDIEQDSLGNYHKAYIDNSTGNYEIYYTNDIGGQFPQDWNAPTRITDTGNDSLLIDLGIYLVSDTMFIIWKEVMQEGNQTVNLTYYTLSRDLGVNWTDPARSYENIRLKYAEFDPLIDEPDLPPYTPTNNTAYYVVQMKTPVIQEWWDGIEGLGGELFGYVPKNAHKARMSASEKDDIEQLPYVRWIGILHPLYKISGELHSIVESGGSGDNITLDITVFDNLNSAITQIENLGGVIDDVSDPYIITTIQDTKIYDIASILDINWIEKKADVILHNNEAIGITNVNHVWNHYPEGLTGKGQIIGIADTGLDTGDVNTIHPDFQNKEITSYALGRPGGAGDWSDQNGHGTHVAGTALGNGIILASDRGFSISVVDSTGNIYITGGTDSANFPVTYQAYDETQNGGHDAFVARFDADWRLVFSTFFGGTLDDQGNSIAIDQSGNIYITGYTYSDDFPTTSGVIDNQLGGLQDAFVAKFTPTGSLVYSTYLGGGSNDEGNSITVDSQGNAYITGSSQDSTSTFPIAGIAYSNSNEGFSDVFISKLNADASSLIYSTLLGGDGYDFGNSIALVSNNLIYITGYTDSDNFPTTFGALDRVLDGFSDAFVSKLDITEPVANQQLIFSTYLGGSDDESGCSIKVFPSGGNNLCYVTGYTESNNFPTRNEYQGYLRGGRDAFVSKLENSGASLLYSTYLGGDNYEYGNSIAVDSNGNAIVTGETQSDNFPTTPNAFDTDYTFAAFDAFISKINPSLIGQASLMYSTYLGSEGISGNNNDFGMGIAIDSNSDVYVVGYTKSDAFPTTYDGYDESHNGGNDVFLSKLSSDLSELEYSTYLGGAGRFTGVAYESDLVFQSIMDENGDYTNGLPTDLNTLFQQAYNDGARIHSNSWGFIVTGEYISKSKQVDTFMWNNKDMLILFGAGNHGVDYGPDGIPNNGDEDGEVDRDSIEAPGTAKNVLTVGASENYRPSVINLDNDYDGFIDEDPDGDYNDDGWPGAAREDDDGDGGIDFNDRSTMPYPPEDIRADPNLFFIASDDGINNDPWDDNVIDEYMEPYHPYFDRNEDGIVTDEEIDIVDGPNDIVGDGDDDSNMLNGIDEDDDGYGGANEKPPDEWTTTCGDGIDFNDPEIYDIIMDHYDFASDNAMDNTITGYNPANDDDEDRYADEDWPDTWGGNNIDNYPENPIRDDSMADNPNGMSAESGRGPPHPVSDERIKPDITAPGTYIISTRSQQWAFDDDVEGGGTGWTPQGTWAITNSAYHTGQSSWTDSPGGNYANNADTRLISPTIDLRTGGDTIRIWHKYDFQYGADFGRVIVSDGTNEHILREFTGSSSSSYFIEDKMDLLIGYLTDNGWDLQNIQIIFELTSDATITDDGWYIDDIRVYSNGDGRLQDIGFTKSGSIYDYDVDEHYISMSGTSTAVPHVAGGAALVRQYYTDIQGITPVQGQTPSAALIKATIINGAIDMMGQYVTGGDSDYNGATESRPNEHEGWGRLDLMNSLFPTGNRILKFVEETNGFTAQGQQQTYYVSDATNPIKITLVWTDPPSDPGISPDLVNDLNLKVTSPGGTWEFYGNDFTSNGWSASRNPGDDSYDSVNNVENVYITTGSPIPGTWTIEVIANQISSDPLYRPQPYALIISYGQDPLTVDLYQGDNFISLPLEPDRPFITEVLRSIDGKYSIVKYYDASDSQDPWKNYYPDKPDSMNDLWYLYPYMGFWVTVPQDMTLTVYGAHFTEDHDILLYNGWNDVGYPALNAYERDDALFPLIHGVDIQVIYWYDTQVSTWYTLEDTDSFEPKKGYSMYCNNAQDTWIVDHDP